MSHKFLNKNQNNIIIYSLRIQIPTLIYYVLIWLGGTLCIKNIIFFYNTLKQYVTGFKNVLIKNNVNLYNMTVGLYFITHFMQATKFDLKARIVKQIMHKTS